MTTEPVTTPALRPEVKEQWLAALRSGDYKQGAERLAYRDGDGVLYCCLGVLCELGVKAGVVESVRVGQDPLDGDLELVGYRKPGGDVNFTTMPPHSIAEWAYGGALPPIGQEWRVTSPHGTRPWLAELNDADGLTFGEIADLIQTGL